MDMKKIFSFFSICLSFIFLFITINVINGYKVSNVLYSNYEEIYFEYNIEKMNVDDFLQDLIIVSEKSNSNIALYNFTGIKNLNIYSSNPKFYDTQGIINVNSTSEAYKLNIPSNFLEVKLYQISEAKNKGIGNVFYISGNISSIKKTLSKYGTVSTHSLNKGNTYSLDSGLILILVYMLLAFVIYLVYFSFKQMKEIALNKIFGYSFFDVFYTSITKLNSMFWGLFIGLLIFFVWGIFNDAYEVKNSFILLLLALLSLILLLLCIYSIFILVNYLFVNSFNSVNGSQPIKFQLIILYIGLVVLLCLGGYKINNLTELVESIKSEQKNNSIWENTQNLYKFNATNQIDRSNLEEEKAFDHASEVFYKKLINEYDTFIIQPYNFQRVYFNDSTYEFLGRNRTNTEEEFITNNYGNNIVVDLNFLKKHELKTITKGELKTINVEPNCIYLLVPYKYRQFINQIESNYLDDYKYFLELDSIIDSSNLDEIKIKTIYIENNQKLFSYNTKYGDPDDGYNIKDSIITVMNPNLMDALFWGNLFTSDGGIYINDEDITYTDLEELLKQSGLQNKLNFLISVYSEHGEDIYMKNIFLFQNIIQTIILIIITYLIIFQIITYIYKIYEKNIFLQKCFGYPSLSIFIDMSKYIFIIYVFVYLLLKFNNLSSNLFYVFLLSNILITFLCNIYSLKKNQIVGD